VVTGLLTAMWVRVGLPVVVTGLLTPGPRWLRPAQARLTAIAGSERRSALGVERVPTPPTAGTGRAADDIIDGRPAAPPTTSSADRPTDDTMTRRSTGANRRLNRRPGR
jgi:hypothetical protein